MDNSYKSSSSSQQKFKVIFNSPVVVSFSGICLAAMLLDYLTGGWSTVTFFSTYESSWLNPLTYVRLVGHIFGHGSWEHFFQQYYYSAAYRANAGGKVWLQVYL